MAEVTEGIVSTRARFEQMFGIIAAAMKNAADKADHGIASTVAEQLGLTEIAASKPIGSAWQRTESGITLWFQWRYYDQSKPFSIQKDMNILSLELREGSKVLMESEERFED